jgi:hypothetical protein
MLGNPQPNEHKNGKKGAIVTTQKWGNFHTTQPPFFVIFIQKL